MNALAQQMKIVWEILTKKSALIHFITPMANVLNAALTIIAKSVQILTNALNATTTIHLLEQVAKKSQLLLIAKKWITMNAQNV